MVKGRYRLSVVYRFNARCRYRSEKENVDVSGKIKQTERYAYGFNIATPLVHRGR